MKNVTLGNIHVLVSYISYKTSLRMNDVAAHLLSLLSLYILQSSQTSCVIIVHADDIIEKCLHKQVFTRELFIIS